MTYKLLVKNITYHCEQMNTSWSINTQKVTVIIKGHKNISYVIVMASTKLGYNISLESSKGGVTLCLKQNISPAHV